MAMKKFRNMKVYEQSGYQYKSTPAIMLKGQWLREAGFDCGTSITYVQIIQYRRKRGRNKFVD